MSKYKKKSILAAAALAAILLTVCGAANKGTVPEADSKVTGQAAETTAGKDTFPMRPLRIM